MIRDDGHIIREVVGSGSVRLDGVEGGGGHSAVDRGENEVAIVLRASERWRSISSALAVILTVARGTSDNDDHVLWVCVRLSVCRDRSRVDSASDRVIGSIATIVVNLLRIYRERDKKG